MQERSAGCFHTARVAHSFFGGNRYITIRGVNARGSGYVFPRGKMIAKRSPKGREGVVYGNIRCTCAPLEMRIGGAVFFWPFFPILEAVQKSD